MNEHELMHYGVLGMKWGVRRYQNKDGTRTEAGKKKYSRKELREISNYKSSVYKKERDKGLIKVRPELRKIEDNAYAIAKRYGLDPDDGGGGDNDKYSERTLTNASKRYWAEWDKHTALENKVNQDARDKARQAVIDKYGDYSLPQLTKYHNQNAAIALGVTFTLPVALVLLDQLG